MSGPSLERFDLIVVGLGAMGSAALFHGARSGARVLGIDRFDPPHTQGSSHAETRITRLAVGEGPQYLPFVARAHEIWQELEARSGTRLLYQPGGYILSAEQTIDERWGDFVSRTAKIADGAGIPFERRSSDEFSRHLPNVRLQGGENIGYEPTGGVILSERAVELQLAEAVAAGAEKLTNTVVTAVEPHDRAGVVVTCGDGRSFTADKAIVTTGAWFDELAPPVDGAAVEVTRQVVHWFEVDDAEPFSAERFPFIIWAADTIDDYLGVFPMIPGGISGFKIVSEQFSQTTDPHTVDRTVSPGEIERFYERLVADRFVGVGPRCIKAEVCLYTNTTDDHFLIDTHPASEQVLYASPCSGHGFKHSTALGEAMAQLMLTGASTLDLSPFTRNRLATAG